MQSKRGVHEALETCLALGIETDRDRSTMMIGTGIGTFPSYEA